MLRIKKWLATTLALAALAWTTSHGHQALIDSRAKFPADKDLLYLPPPAYLRFSNLGYRELMADLIWIRAVIFAGDRIGGANIEWISRYLEAIFELAPTFRRPYAWGGVSAIYTGQTIDRSMVDQALSLYRRGLHHFPEDHEMLFAAGMLLSRDMQSLPGYSEAERKKAKQEGQSMIRKAAAFGAPPLVRQLAASQLDSFASDELAIQFLESQLLQSDDKNHRRVLQQKIEDLQGRSKVEHIERLRSATETRRDAEFPYLPLELYTVIRSQSSASPSVGEAKIE